jgi:hypothetical protein
MKRLQLSKNTLAALLTIGGVFPLPVFADIGGSLTPPPGVPSPSMKSLDQIEARSPLVEGSTGVSIAENGTATISQSDSYYLTGDLVVSSGNGIVVNANAVTIDLNGFSVTTTLRATSSELVEATVKGVTVLGCGFAIDTLGLVESCTVTSSKFTGIVGSIVKNCAAANCGLDGIRGTDVVAHCSGRAINGEGIECNGSVTSCYGYSAKSSGIRGDVVVDSEGASRGTTSGAHGIIAKEIAKHSIGSALKGDGVRARIAIGCVGKNTLGVGHGIRATIANSCVSEGTTSILKKFDM